MNEPGGASGSGAHAGLVLGGRYRLLAPIGAGGMAVVWQAHDSVLARSVAVKMVTPGQARDERSRERIRLEARAAGALSHPNIAQVHDFGTVEIDGQVLPYVVMELVTGGTLLRRLAAGPVVPGFAMRVGAEIAAALAAAHAEGLVHRDIKPGNVILAPTGAKVVDFGIAAAARTRWPEPPGSRRPADGGEAGILDEVLGTPAYLAPERLVGDAVVPASDVYALGVVLYRMLSGRSPWNSENTRQMLEAHLYVPPLPLPPLDGVPDRVVELCNRCLAKDPERRPTAEEVAVVLRESAGLRVMPVDRPVEPIRPDGVSVSGPVSVAAVPSAAAVAGGGAPAEVRADGGRVPAVRWAAAAALLLTAGAAGWLFLRDDDDGGAGGVVAVESAAVPSAGGAVPAGSGAPRTAATGMRTAATRQATPGAATSAPAPAVGTTSTTAPAPRPTATTTATAAPTVTATTAEPEPVRRTLSSAGGSVVAVCHSVGSAEILSWDASGSYKVRSTDPGPSPAPSVTFKHGNEVVTMTVSCDSGAPALA
ncbi:serine/threonine-protein kinase [Actinoplanes sp. NPDC049802]|uniref:serine/threonine-protein kinase n=1 Tax=Actinoplanes sp. NPDC049802 TaxID=3154742 RepID=UPI0033CEDBAA